MSSKASRHAFYLKQHFMVGLNHTCNISFAHRLQRIVNVKRFLADRVFWQSFSWGANEEKCHSKN